MEAFSFIPYLEIWTISNHTGIDDTNAHANLVYISDIYMAWRGVSFYLVWWVCPEPLKTDNSNSLTLSFYINLSC